MKKNARPVPPRRRHLAGGLWNVYSILAMVCVVGAALGYALFRAQDELVRPATFERLPGTESWRGVGESLMAATPAPAASPGLAATVQKPPPEEKGHAQDHQHRQQQMQQQQTHQQQQTQQQQQQQQQTHQQQQTQQQQQQQQTQPQQQHAAPATKTRVVITLDYSDMASGSAGDDFEAVCEKAGKNVGNLVWLYSASKHIMDPDKNDLMTVKTRHGDVDAVVIPSANILWNMTELDKLPNKAAMLADFATIRPGPNYKPHFIIGMGVSGYEGLGISTSELFGDLGEVYLEKYTPADYVLHSTYVTTLKAIGEKNSGIGVRGPFTERLLHSYGVSTAVALGCPSLFADDRPDLGAVLQAKIAALGSSSRLAINLPQRWLPRLMTFLLRLAMQSKDHVIVWQSPTDVWFLKRAQKELGIAVPPEKIKWFRDFESWSASTCHYDALIGSRIHGNMIGVSCATPMLLIASDIRTHEMGMGMKIPMLQTDHALFQQLGPKLDDRNQTFDLPSLSRLFEEAKFDGAAFDKNRYLQASRYDRILKSMNIVPSERIRKLAMLHV
jgi:Polysaccharide pyruvyl transferase